jgi:hypothetical protein
MESLRYNEQSSDIILTPEDVESAIRHFICDYDPTYSKNWLLSPKYNLGSIVFAATRNDHPDCTPTTEVKILLSHEVVQTFAHMNTVDAHNYIEEFYGIESDRIVTTKITAESTLAPTLHTAPSYCIMIIKLKLI